MADIINLRTVRKQQARSAALAKGNENATRFGLNKALRDLTKARAEKSARDLDGHRLEGLGLDGLGLDGLGLEEHGLDVSDTDLPQVAPVTLPPNTVALFPARPKAT